MVMCFNQKGQAAITDALFFLSIVGVLSTMMITSSMHYGLDIMSNVQHDYEKNYLDAGLKTISVSAYGRNGESPLYSKDNDLVMTKVFEDVATGTPKPNTVEPDKVYVLPNTQKAIFGTLNQIFAPFQQKSFLFAMYFSLKSDQEKTVFIGIRTYLKKNNEIKRYDIVCDTNNSLEFIKHYLQTHNSNLVVTTSNTTFYYNLFAKSKDVQSYNGFLYLAMWNSISDNSFFQNPQNVGDVGESFTYNWGQNPNYEVDCNVLTIQPND